MRINAISLLLIVVCCCSCNSKGSSQGAIRKRILHRESHYTCPVCPPYIVEEQLIEIDSEFVLNGKKIDKYFVRDGYYKEQWKDGSSLRLDFYKNGVQDSICRYYFQNGKLAHESNYFGGEALGSDFGFGGESGYIEEYKLMNNDSAVFKIK
jgi:hypothetical protein